MVSYGDDDDGNDEDAYIHNKNDDDGEYCYCWARANINIIREFSFFFSVCGFFIGKQIKLSASNRL